MEFGKAQEAKVSNKREPAGTTRRCRAGTLHRRSQCALSDVAARQNHAIFGRRGCGKTLLLHHSARTLPKDIRPIYLNCEDFKKHSFPNVLIEILDALFGELERHLTGWFRGRRRGLDSSLAIFEKDGAIEGLQKIVKRKMCVNPGLQVLAAFTKPKWAWR